MRLPLAVALLRARDCEPAPALVARNDCQPYDNRCAQRAGYGGALLEVPTVDAREPGFLSSQEFIESYVQGGRPLLLKHAASFFLDHPEMFTSSSLLQNTTFASLRVDVTSSGREVANREVNKHAHDSLIPVSSIFGPGRHVFFQAWKVDEEYLGLGEQADHLDRPPKFTVQGDESFAASSFAFAHVKRDHGLFRHEGHFNFLMAQHGGVLPHHHAAVLNVLTQGAKRWTLVPPDAYASEQQRLQFEDWKHTPATGGGTSYLSQQWYNDKAEKIKALRHYDFVQEAGDAVFFPNAFTHATLDLCAPTVAFIQKGQFFEVPSFS